MSGIERWWQVSPWLPEAELGEPGHPTYVAVAQQGRGRFDNPRWYTAGYVAASPQGAVGEVFAHHPVWRAQMLTPPFLPGSVRALVEFRAPDLRLVDLDDPHVLLEYGWRPSDVVRRNRDRTQELGLRLFLAGDHHGVQWWSYHRPEWTVATLWKAHTESGEPPSPFADLAIEAVEPLTLEHPAVRLAAEILRKPIER